MKKKNKKLTIHRQPRRFIILSALILLILITTFSIIILNKKSNLLHRQQAQDQQDENPTLATQSSTVYLAFTEEIFDRIKKTYWDKIDDNKLLNIYELAAEKITGQNQNIVFKNKKGLAITFKQITTPMDETAKKDFTVQLSTIVLANLEPFGRSGLFSEEQKQNLINNVNNIDPTINLYQSINADKSASPAEIKQKYTQTKKKLKQILNSSTASPEKKTEAQKKLALADRAYETIGNNADRKLYDQDKIESTVEAKVLSPFIFYLRIKKMSPTSFQDFQNTINTVDAQNDKLNTLILDLRGNVGGSVDLMQWFLGPFIGENNTAYEFYHQGEYEPFKTKTGWLKSLIRYKKFIVLINGQTQSSAEVMAATLKKYNVGILLGEHTKGWGTIEKVFALKNQIDPEQKYSVFLVHSLTLRDDHQPIQGHGVDPDINIQDANWEKQLNEYYNFPALITAIKKVL